MTSRTYSFLSVSADISGPNGSFNLSSGNTEGGISVTMRGPKNTLTIGADGSGMNTLVADKSAEIIVRLLKTSPQNAALSSMLAFQRTSAANWGQNILNVNNSVSGDSFNGSLVAFAKQPVVTYDRDGRMNEWRFTGLVEMILGAGVGF